MRAASPRRSATSCASPATASTVASSSRSTSRPGTPTTADRTDRHAGWIAVGQIMGAFGQRGEVRVKLLGRFPERFREVRRVYVGDDHVPADVLHRRRVGPGVALRLSTVQSRDAARELFQQYLYLPETEAVKLPAGEYFVHQIIGLQVVTTEGEALGPVREVVETGSNDVYVVDHAGKELLLPATKEVIRNVDLDAGTLEVALLPGLID